MSGTVYHGTVYPTVNRRRVLVCLRSPGLDPRVCLGCRVFRNGDGVPRYLRVQFCSRCAKDLRAQSLVTGSSIEVTVRS
jgi:hypothetical protein